MLFIVFVLIVWIIFIVWYKRKMKERYRFSKALLPLVLFSYLVTIDLGINYAIPDLTDGIGLNSKFAGFIIGENRWTLEVFKDIFIISLAISILLTSVFLILLFVNRKK